MSAGQHDQAAGMADLRGVKIICVATVPFFVVTQLGRQIEAMLAAGMRVTVVTSPGSELERLKAHPYLAIHTLDIRRDIAPRADMNALWKLSRLFLEWHPDIVHSTTPKAGLLAAMAARIAGVPVRLHTFTGQPWLGLSGPKRLVARFADRVIGRLNTMCFADSPSQCRFLMEEGLLPANRIATIAHGSLAGVDLDRFSVERLGPEVRERIRGELNIGAGTPLLLFIGRIAREKGIREMLDAAKQLHAEKMDFCLLLVGPMDDEAGGGETVSRTEFDGLPFLRYIGYTATPENYFCAADIFCLPSYREGFGTTVIEAAAMGLPTVGTRIVGLIDAIVDGQTGLLVAPRNVSDLAAALRELLNAPELRKHLGTQARQRVCRLFAADQVNGLLLKEYGSLLHGSRTAAPNP